MRITCKFGVNLFFQMFDILDKWVNHSLSRIDLLKNISPSYTQFFDDIDSGTLREYIINNPHKGKQMYRELFPFFTTIKENYE